MVFWHLALDEMEYAMLAAGYNGEFLRELASCSCLIVFGDPLAEMPNLSGVRIQVRT